MEFRTQLAHSFAVTKTPRCILVDDDQNFLAFTRRIFSEVCPDYEIVEFRSGLEAVEFLGHHCADLVIADFQMPEFNGLQMTAAMRAMGVEVPVLIVSGEEIGGEAQASGATAFLSKVKLSGELKLMLSAEGIVGRRLPGRQSRKPARKVTMKLKSVLPAHAPDRRSPRSEAFASGRPTGGYLAGCQVGPSLRKG